MHTPLKKRQKKTSWLDQNKVGITIKELHMYVLVMGGEQQHPRAGSTMFHSHRTLHRQTQQSTEARTILCVNVCLFVFVLTLLEKALE